MYEHVTVESITETGDVMVGCDAKACENCSGGMFCNVKHKTFVAKNPDQLTIHPGDVVELYLHPGKTIFSSFLTLIFPLLFFPLGYVLASVFQHDPSELIRLVYGVVGVVLGFVLAWLYFRKKRHSYIPVVTSIVSSAEACDHDCKTCASRGECNAQ